MCTKNGMHSSGATERGVVVFSRIMFGLRDLDSGGVSRRGDDQPTRAFFSFGFALMSGLWLPPHLVAARRPSGHGCFATLSYYDVTDGLLIAVHKSSFISIIHA